MAAGDKIIGITDEQTHCDACGRIELRSTVIIGDTDGTEIGRYGSTCAARYLTAHTGTTHTGTAVLSTARLIEAVRRSNVTDALHSARRAASRGDMLAAMRHRAAAVETGLTRPDEIAANERLLGWARDFRACRAGAYGSNDTRPARTQTADLIARGWTVQQIAAAVKVAASTVRRWLSGATATPGRDNAHRLTQLVRSGAVPA